MINNQKASYKTEVEEYNWEQEEIIPYLTEEEYEHEYNEQGNYITTKTSCLTNANEIQLIEIDDETRKYRENYIRIRHSEYFFGRTSCFIWNKQKYWYGHIRK